MERLPVLCARLGLCSRSEATKYIKLGLVAVDGKPASSPAALVNHAAVVTLLERGQRMQAEKVTIALHKPLHYASCRAGSGTPLARNLLVPENRAFSCRTRYDPRKLRGLSAADVLDESADGLVIFSQDGRVATRVARDITLEKEYKLFFPGGVSASQMVALRACFESEAAAAMQNDPSNDLDAAPLAECEIGECQETEGGDAWMPLVVRGTMGSRSVRQGCQLAGLPSALLSRVRVGRIRLGRLPAGQWTVVKAADIL